MNRIEKIIKYIEDHDEKWLFFIGYLLLSFILSVIFNLGVFIILLMVHFMLDVLKHWNSTNRKTNSLRQAMKYAFRDGLLFDVFLLVLAFAFGFVLHATFAIGISRGIKLASSLDVRAFLRAVPRIFVADWIIENITTLTMYLSEHDKKKTYMPIRMTKFERFTCLATVIVLCIIFILPPLLGESYATLGEYAKFELIPFFGSV